MSFPDFDNPAEQLINGIVATYLHKLTLDEQEVPPNTYAIQSAIRTYFNKYLTNKYPINEQEAYLVERNHINLGNKDKLIQLVREGITLKKLDDIL